MKAFHSKVEPRLQKENTRRNGWVYTAMDVINLVEFVVGAAQVLGRLGFVVVRAFTHL